jgi:hypothetical protein
MCYYSLRVPVDLRWQIVVDARGRRRHSRFIDNKCDLIVAAEAQIGTIEQVHEEHVRVSVPVGDIAESDPCAGNYLAVQARQIIYLPCICPVMIKIKLP